MLRSLAVLSAALPLVCFAETPFAGTWIVQSPLTTFELRPWGLLIDRGIYKRTSCTPADEVPADGAEHAISGDPLVETMSVRLVDAGRVEVAQKISGKLIWKGLYTVAKDGQTMQLKYEDDRAAKPVIGAIEFTREGDRVPGAHLFSGTWQPQRLLELSASGLSMAIKDTDNGLAMNASDGRSFDIKFNRQDFPLKGFLDGATVQVGRRAPMTLQVNRKQHGSLVEMSLGTVSDDGQTMLLGQIDRECGSKITWTLRKQPAP